MRGQADLLFPLEFTTPMTLGDASGTLTTPPADVSDRGR